MVEWIGPFCLTLPTDKNRDDTTQLLFLLSLFFPSLVFDWHLPPLKPDPPLPRLSWLTIEPFWALSQTSSRWQQDMVYLDVSQATDHIMVSWSLPCGISHVPSPRRRHCCFPHSLSPSVLTVKHPYHQVKGMSRNMNRNTNVKRFTESPLPHVLNVA